MSDESLLEMSAAAGRQGTLPFDEVSQTGAEVPIEIVVAQTLRGDSLRISNMRGSGTRIEVPPNIARGPLAAALTRVFVPSVRAAIVNAIDDDWMEPRGDDRGLQADSDVELDAGGT